MCWNASVSLNTFLLASSVLVIGIVNKVIDPWSSIAFISYAIMQLIEYFLWTYLHDAKINRVFSFIGFIIILIQPIAMLTLLQRDSKYHVLQTQLLFFYLIYILVVIFGIIHLKILKFNTTVATNGHLLWEWIPRNILWLLPWFFVFFTPIILTSSPLVKVFSISAFIISYVAYMKYHTWGSMWCWFISAASVYYIFVIMVKTGTCVET